ncbi:MAG: cytochrome P450, partial [Ilumatobacteraceae bacterium]
MTDTLNTPSDASTTEASATTYLPPGDRPEGHEFWERKPYDPADYGPVADFATDFDHGSAEYNAKAPEVWKELRESGCPVAHSERYGGMWVPLTHDTVHDVAYDTDNFSSRSVVISTTRPGDLALPAPIGGAPPITSDPPFHNVARRLLLP